MARRPRLEFPGAFYHVIARGNEQKPVFRDAQDPAHYLSLLADYQKKLGFELYAFVLMKNHVHFLVEVHTVRLSKIMQRLQTAYTQWFNRKYKRVGHLFQGRYKAILCDRDSYLLELVRYVHLNPVRSKIASDPREHPWNSHRNYLGLVNHAWLNTTLVLGMLGPSMAKARNAYVRFIEDGKHQGHRDDLYQLRGHILGDDEFIEKVEGIVEYKHEPWELEERRNIEIDEFCTGVSKLLSIPKEEICSSSRRRVGALGRDILAYTATRYTTSSVTKLARYLKRTPASVSRAKTRGEKELLTNKKLRTKVESYLSNYKKAKSNV